MRPGISSTANIGDNDFNLTVKRYDIPKANSQGVSVNVTNFEKTDSALPAGNSRLWSVFSDFTRIKTFWIDSIRINAFRTNSSGAIQTISVLSATLSAAGTTMTGLSSWVTTGNPADLDTQFIVFSSSPSSYGCVFNGPILYSSSQIRLEVTAYNAITLNDIIYWNCQIYWRPA